MQHLENEGVDFLQFAFRWVNCLLLREFPFKLIPRIWDTYVSEAGGTKFSEFLVRLFWCRLVIIFIISHHNCMEKFVQKILLKTGGFWLMQAVASPGLCMCHIFAPLGGSSGGHGISRYHHVSAEGPNWSLDRERCGIDPISSFHVSK